MAQSVGAHELGFKKMPGQSWEFTARSVKLALDQMALEYFTQKDEADALRKENADLRAVIKEMRNQP